MSDIFAIEASYQIGLNAGRKEVETVKLNRLSEAVYADLEKQVNSNLHVGADTTAMQAAWNLGAQHVLRKLREGFVA